MVRHDVSFKKEDMQMTKANIPLLVALAALLTGCSSFPVGSTWQVKQAIDPGRELTMTLSFQDAGELIQTHEYTGTGDNTSHTNETKYTVDGNRLKALDPKKNQWEETVWRIEGDTLIFVKDDGKENRMTRVKDPEANK
jgi:hypothetical protein